MILHRHHFGAGFGKQACGDTADVTETLDRDPRTLDVHAALGGRFATHHIHAAAGRFVPTQAAAEGNRLAGDDAGGGAADVHREGIHHPRHGLLIGVDVRRRDILVRPDDDADFAGVTARDALQFAFRERLRIEADAALGTAVWHIDCGILDRHPGRQRHHFRQRHILMETHAALARTARHIVLHPIAFEVGNRAVIALDRDIDHQDALRTLERLDPARQRAEIRRDAIDLLKIDAPWAEVVVVEVGRDCVLTGHAVNAP